MVRVGVRLEGYPGGAAAIGPALQAGRNAAHRAPGGLGGAGGRRCAARAATTATATTATAARDPGLGWSSAVSAGATTVCGTHGG